MRAFVVTGPGQCSVQEVEPPAVGPGEVVVDVVRVGVCGTDVEFFTGEMAYLHDGHATYPMRLGHEWSGVVSEVGPGVDASWRRRLKPGDRVLILGPGTIGTLAAQFARAAGAEVHVLGEREPSLSFARSLGIEGVWTAADLPRLAFDAVIDASTAPELPALALELVEPGKRVVYIGISGTPSTIDTRTMLLKDVTAVGVLSGSPALARAVEAYADGSVDPRPLVAATVGLDRVADVLAGRRPRGAGPGPKIHVDPQLIEDKDIP